MGRQKIPGLSIVIVKDGEILFSKGYGLRSIERNLPSNPDTLYGLGSVTKSFTGLAIMKLAQNGRLDISDSITEYLPELKADRNNEKVSISHLLTHTSGLPALNIAEIHLMKGIGSDTTFIPAEEYEDFLGLYLGARDERTQGIGKRFMYSNEGFTILGEIIERVSKKKYQDFIRESILRPLGMNRSTFSGKTATEDTNCAQCYHQKGPGKLEPVSFPDNALLYAPGGLISSVTELANYLTMWMNGGTFKNSSILKPDLVKKALEPVPHNISKIPSSISYYNTGWMVKRDFFGHALVSHSGSTDVSSANLAFLPDVGIGVAIGSNSGFTPTQEISEYVLASLIGKDPAKYLESYIVMDLTHKLEGVYRDYRNYTKATVRAKDSGYLELKFESDEMVADIPLFIENKKVFTMQSGKRIEVPCLLGEDGVKEMIVERHRFVRSS